jgi:hypothetical protein
MNRDKTAGFLGSGSAPVPDGAVTGDRAARPQARGAQERRFLGRDSRLARRAEQPRLRWPPISRHHDSGHSRRMRRSGSVRELCGRLPARVRAGSGAAVGSGLSAGAWA